MLSRKPTLASDCTGGKSQGIWPALIDLGSDGAIDETVELENKVGRIYLPLILRSFL
jgi:hypothetical protein